MKPIHQLIAPELTYDVERRNYRWIIAIRKDAGGAFKTLAEAQRIQAQCELEDGENECEEFEGEE